MSNFQERLESEVNKLGVSELAAQLGVARNTIYNWVQKGNAPLNRLMDLKERGVDVDYVVTGSRFVANAQNIEQATNLDANDEIAHHSSLKPHTHIVNESTPQSYIDEFVHVPRYDVSASAGAGAVVNDESIVDHLAFKREWIVRTLGLDPKRLALLDVVGDSMTPTINDGDLILLDTREGQALAEGIYVINFGESLLVKRLRMRLSGVVDVVSDNERYGIETISGDQLNTLQIVGRVVWQGRRI